ncbi:hypothetical protein GO986_04275 [Deinococcus sp. HMF7620]|uniref:Uncharacterized protein n=1 Tax=Deinococcus arboris TaxID=2682977 RepID=A0A7C9HYA8_9DEIO|nr:hypothetical protein [Deinococcus arboris]MVN85975.1 hypothetical protein [Deinococcus arboris]
MTDKTDNDIRAHEDTDQQDVIEDGMQGATGNADANGLDPNANLDEKLEELRENLTPISGANTSD